jgi:hypothetical protein
LQWWGALTKQFTELATTAMKDTAGDAARKLAGAMVRNPLDGSTAAASKRAAPAPAKKARKAAPKARAKRAVRKAAPSDQ